MTNEEYLSRIKSWQEGTLHGLYFTWDATEEKKSMLLAAFDSFRGEREELPRREWLRFVGESAVTLDWGQLLGSGAERIQEDDFRFGFMNFAISRLRGGRHFILHLD